MAGLGPDEKFHRSTISDRNTQLVAFHCTVSSLNPHGFDLRIPEIVIRSVVHIGSVVQCLLRKADYGRSVLAESSFVCLQRHY